MLFYIKKLLQPQYIVLKVAFLYKRVRNVRWRRFIMIITEDILHKNITKHIKEPVIYYFISFGLNLTDNSYLYPDCKDYHKIYLVRINNSKALGYTCNDYIYFNIPSFEKKSHETSYYLASLLVSVFAHESTNHDIIDYRFIPPIKEVQEQLDKFYDINNHAEETLPCYFSLALLDYKKSADKLYDCGKGLLLNQYYILRDNILQNVRRYFKKKYMFFR